MWNVEHVTKSVSALLTLCPNKIWHGQRANSLATSTSPSLGDPDEMGYQVDQATFTPSRPYLSWDQGSYSTHPLKLAVSDRRGTASTVEKGNTLRCDFGRINCSHSELLTATSATTSRPLSSAKTRLTSTLRLRLTSRETPTLLRLPYAGMKTKSSPAPDNQRRK